MLKVGITGGIGSGKTTVCKVFEALSIPVYYADVEAKSIVNENKRVKESIVNAFGNSVVDDDGNIIRPVLASIVFNDKHQLNVLNSIVHPAVAQHFLNWLVEHAYSPYILKEAAILFESESYKQVDKIISVVASLPLRLQRTIKRDNVSEELVLQRIKNQISDEERIKRSDYIIYNNETDLIIPQVIKIHEQLLNLKA